MIRFVFWKDFFVDVEVDNLLEGIKRGYGELICILSNIIIKERGFV